LKSFKDNYVNSQNFDDLKSWLSHFYKRTLRKDVVEYVKYTERIEQKRQALIDDIK